MRSAGIDRVDVLVVSHADIDHAGGVRSMLAAAPVAQSYSSFDLHAYLRREARLLGKQGDLPPLPLALSACVAGISWTLDGVSFRFLWTAYSIPRKPPGQRRQGRDKSKQQTYATVGR